MEYKIYRTDELYHHGIKGMRWGVRRYQNKDGSLTPAGAKRRAKLESKLEKLGGNKKAVESSNTEQPAKKTASNMTDDELAKAISRARMEDEYRRLRPEPKAPEKGAFMKQVINEAVKPALISTGKKALESAMGQVVEKLTKGKVDPNSIEALKKTYEKLDYKQKIDKIVNPDKYLSEEDKNKRQQRQFAEEDRAAKMEGYMNAIDKANKMRNTGETPTNGSANTVMSDRTSFNRSVMDGARINKLLRDADRGVHQTNSREPKSRLEQDEYEFDYKPTSKTVDTFVKKTQNTKVSDVTKGMTSRQIQARLEREYDWDYGNWRDYEWDD